MIPWLNIPSVPNPLPWGPPRLIHAFGVLVAIGILVGARLTRDRGRELGLVDEDVLSMITTTVLCGFIFAHVFDVFAYQTHGPRPTWRDIVNLFSGLSSFGGFMGALVGLFYWCWKRRTAVMPYADSLAFGLATGWFFGRMGCFSAHDHPGRITHFFLAVRYQDAVDSNGVPLQIGGPRHDLGLYEALWALAVSLLFFWLRRKNRPVGTYVTILTLAYAPVRFGLDFLRATDIEGADPRYFGLTPAQYGSILVLIVGIVLALWTRKRLASAA